MKQGKFQKIVFLFVTCETVTKLCRQILPFSMLTQVCILTGQMPSMIVNMAKHNYIMSLGHQGWAECGGTCRSSEHSRGRLRQVDLCELEASLVYIGSSMTARDIYSLSQNKTKTKSTSHTVKQYACLRNIL